MILGAGGGAGGGRRREVEICLATVILVALKLTTIPILEFVDFSRW